MKINDKIYVVIDRKIAEERGIGYAVCSKPFTNITRPKVICAVKNYESKTRSRYVVKEISLASNLGNDRAFIVKEDNPYFYSISPKLVFTDEIEEVEVLDNE